MITSSSTKLKFVSLYCGAGGLDIGFSQAGFEPVYSIDSNPDAINSYKTFFRDHEIICDDVKNFSFTGKANLVIGGPPCQGFSVAGYADPDDPRSQHVLTFMNIVKKVSPQVFVMENVKALAISKKWESKRAELKKFAEELGYSSSFFVLNASDFGVPQSRERMFFIGVKGKKNIKLPPRKSKIVSVREILSKMPPYGEIGNNTICTAKIVIAKKPVMRSTPYSGMFFNGKGRILNLDKPALTLPASMGGNHTPIIDQQCLESGSKNWAETLFENLKQGNKPTKIPKKLRRLTLEEVAALQTFPNKLKFQGSRSSKFKQVGNAVPPLLALNVAQCILNQVFSRKT